MATTGDRIREVRESLRMTQDDLAEKSGLSKGFISDVENDKRGISSENLLRIANAVGASLDYLQRGETSAAVVRESVVIPYELSAAAEQLHLSYAQTLELLDAYNSVVARRSNSGRRPFNVEQWKQFHSAIQKVFNSSDDK